MLWNSWLVLWKLIVWLFRFNILWVLLMFPFGSHFPLFFFFWICFESAVICEAWIQMLIISLFLGFVVRKRTPRIPVSYSYRKDNCENYVSPNKRRRKLNVDEDVAHVAALALTEASHRGGSSQVSQSPFRTDHIKSSPLKGRERRVIILDTRALYLLFSLGNFAI